MLRWRYKDLRTNRVYENHHDDEDDHALVSVAIDVQSIVLRKRVAGVEGRVDGGSMMHSSLSDVRCETES